MARRVVRLMHGRLTITHTWIDGTIVLRVRVHVRNDSRDFVGTVRLRCSNQTMLKGRGFTPVERFSALSKVVWLQGQTVSLSLAVRDPNPTTCLNLRIEQGWRSEYL